MDPDIDFKVGNVDNFFADARFHRPTNAHYEQVDFWKNRDNQVTLIADKSGKMAKVDAHFTEDNQTVHLPTDYNSYRIVFQKDKIEYDDLKPIYAWKTASDIAIFNDAEIFSYVVFMFMVEHVHLFDTANLKSLSVSVGMIECERVVVRPMFEHVRSLETIKFYGRLDLFMEMKECRVRLEAELGNGFTVKTTGFNDTIIITRNSAVKRVASDIKDTFSKWFGEKQK